MKIEQLWRWDARVLCSTGVRLFANIFGNESVLDSGFLSVQNSHMLQR